MYVHVLIADDGTIIGMFDNQVKALECCMRYEQVTNRQYRVETHTVLGFKEVQK